MDYAKLLGREPLTIDEIDEIVLKGKTDATFINSPKSSEYVTNNRGQKIHVRSIWPAKPPRAFMFFLHGYASHANRPTHTHLADEFGQHDVGYITIDFHTHGYSDGEIRCNVEKSDDLVDDVLGVLLAFFSSASQSDTHNIARNVANVPFYFIGHSMGGGVSLLLSNLLTHGEAAVACTDYAREQMAVLASRVMPNFRGSLLMGPMIRIVVPPWLLTVVTPIAYWLPTFPIPTIFRDEMAVCRANWHSEKYTKYILSDTYPNHPKGLMYFGGMRLGTARSLLETCDVVQRSVSQATFPFLIVHDPLDQTVNIEGSRFFVQEAPSESKQLIEMEGGLHDPIANRIDVVFKLMIDFVLKHNEKKGGNGQANGHV